MLDSSEAALSLLDSGAGLFTSKFGVVIFLATKKPLGIVLVSFLCGGISKIEQRECIDLYCVCAYVFVCVCLCVYGVCVYVCLCLCTCN